MSIHSSIVGSIGNTPLIRLNAMAADLYAEIFVKMESRNPLGSVKDRTGLALIEDGERRGALQKNMRIIEATSGNTGIALAFIGAVKNYGVDLVMPETMSIERQRLLRAFGAQLTLTPGHLGMQGAIDKVDQICYQQDRFFMPRQFSNPANPEIHYNTTGPEILADCQDKVDIFVAGVGTGGTISGVGKRLRSVNPNIEIIAVEPSSSPLLSGGKAGPHRIQGIGANFIPPNYDSKLPNEIIAVTDQDATATSRQLARKEGIFCGISAGANIWSALQVAKRPENANKRIVTIICDTGERYLSTWLFAQ